MSGEEAETRINFFVLNVTWGVLPYISQIGMYRPKGYGFCAVSV